MKPSLTIITILFIQFSLAQEPAYFARKLNDNSDQQVMTRSMLQDSLNKLDTNTLVKLIGQLEKETSGASAKMKTRVAALKARSLFYQLGPGDSLYTTQMKDALYKAQELDEPFMVAEYSRWYSEMLNSLGKRSEAVQYALNSIVLQEELGIQYFPTVNTFYFTIGELFLRTRNREDAVKWLNKGIALPGADSVFTSNYANGLNNLALAYYQLKDYRQSLIMDERCMAYCKEKSEINWYNTAYFNRIGSFIELASFDTATSILNELRDLSMLQNDDPMNAGIYYYYGLIATRKNEFQTGLVWLKKAQALVEKTGVRGNLTKIYKELSNCYNGLKQFDEALVYYKESQYLSDSATKVETSQRSDYLFAKANFEKQQFDFKKLKTKRERDIRLRNLGIICIVLVSGLALWWVNRRRRNAMDMHARAEKRLQLFREEMIARNRQVETLESELQSQKNSTENAVKLEELSKQIILTEDDWQRFQSMFNKVYPGFFHRLREKAGGITEAELRMASLVKIQLTTRQIASMQGIGSDAVHKTRQRLRQRFSTSSTSELEAVINEV